MICSKTYPLDKFAKVQNNTCFIILFLTTFFFPLQNQRKNAEKARCIKCIKKREEEDVWASDPDTDTDDEFDFL
jgi:hypothetical protein